MVSFYQTFFVVLAFSFCCSLPVQADIVCYDFDNLSLSPSSTDPLASASAISDTGLFNFFANGTLGYPNAVLQVSSPNGNPTAADAIANSAYFSFVVTPNAGSLMDFSALTFDAARGGAGTPRGYEVRSSVDNFASTLGRLMWGPCDQRCLRTPST